MKIKTKKPKQTILESHNGFYSNLRRDTLQLSLNIVYSCLCEFKASLIYIANSRAIRAAN